ncbi:TPA: multidrug efflux ABC transporter ATP-binding protein LieA, partial [Listeria monocytogenes]
MKEVMIKATGLEKSFKKTEVLKGVDFEVKHGEIFALLGSNGAGKTTTIQILATLLKADNGLATVSSFDVKTEPEKVRKHISLTGQFAAVDGLLTGRENILL